MTRWQWLFGWILSGLFLLAPSTALSQQDETSTDQPDELITDRPDVTESSATAPPMRLQLEAGVLYSYQDIVDDAPPAGHTGKYDAHQFSAPTMLLRFGVTDFAELRLGVPDLTYEDITGDGDDLVVGTASLGTKLAAAPTDGWRVGIIIEGDLDIDTGDFGGAIIGMTSVDLSSRLTFEVNAGMTSEVDLRDERQWDGLVTTALDFELTERLGGFLEAFAVVPEGDIDWFVNTGPTYQVADQVQLDAFLGVQVPNADEIFLGSGVSVLF